MRHEILKLRLCKQSSRQRMHPRVDAQLTLLYKDVSRLDAIDSEPMIASRSTVARIASNTEKNLQVSWQTGVFWN